MAATHTFTHHAADPILGIRVGTDACKRANAQGHSPRGAIMRYARDLAVYGAERTRDEDGNYRHARRSASIKDPSRARPRITLENVLAAEAWYADRRKRPHAATLADAINAAVGDNAASARVRAALNAAVLDASAEGERVRAAQERAAAAARRARQIAAKASR